MDSFKMAAICLQTIAMLVIAGLLALRGCDATRSCNCADGVRGQPVTAHVGCPHCKQDFYIQYHGDGQGRPMLAPPPVTSSDKDL